MKPEHDEIIEARAEAFWNLGRRWRPWSALTDVDRGMIKSRLAASDRAASERGWVLAKIPNRREPPQIAGSPWDEGLNEAIDATETIDIDKEQDNG